MFKNFTFQKEYLMNKLFKTLSLIAVVVFLSSVFAVRAGQVSAASEYLPYGLTMQDTMASVEQKLGQPRCTPYKQAGNPVYPTKAVLQTILPTGQFTNDLV
jgi:hypothetical protein